MKSGIVALAGRPNVGKSTLVNAILATKVAIVSDKPQTTRRRVLGVTTTSGYQLVLADVPGSQRPRDELTGRMQQTVERAFDEVDGILLVLAVSEMIGGGDRFIASLAFGAGVPVVIALNKTDVCRPDLIARQTLQAAALGDFHALHPVSAKTGDGVGALREELVGLLPDGPALFPDEATSDLTVKEQIAELIREKALQVTREEVPHAKTVEVGEIAGAVVRADVIVETESQKRILVGRAGSMIRDIGTKARPEIEQLLGMTVHLELMVKVRRRWRADDAMLSRLGI